MPTLNQQNMLASWQQAASKLAASWQHDGGLYFDYMLSGRGRKCFANSKRKVVRVNTYGFSVGQPRQCRCSLIEVNENVL